MKMAHDVFHHDNRVVHEDADGKNQREERDAIQREAVEIKNEQRQCECCGNRQQHDDGFAPAQHEQDQKRHAYHREQHVPEQFVGFILSRQTIVPRDGDLDIGWNDVALQRIHFFQNLTGNGNCIRTRPLGNGERNGRLISGNFIRRTGTEEHILAWFFRAIRNVRHVAQINRLAGIRAHHHVAHVLCGLQKRAGFHDDFMVVAGKVAGGILLVRLLQHRHQTGG